MHRQLRVNAEPEDVSALLLVSLRSEDEQLSQILEILQQLEIPAEVVRREAVAHPTGRIALRVPPGHVVAAVLALQRHGFTDLRAYGSTSALE